MSKYTIAGGKVFDQSGSVVGKVDRSGKIVMFAQSVSETFDQAESKQPVFSEKDLATGGNRVLVGDASYDLQKHTDGKTGANGIPTAWSVSRFDINPRAADGFPLGDCSLRENAVVWHEGKQCWYLIADIIQKSNPAHTLVDWATFNTEIALFKSADFKTWTYVGICIPKGEHGVASPSGASVSASGEVWVAHAFRTANTVGLSDVYITHSSSDPDVLPWTTLGRPCKTGGADDDAGAIWGGDGKLHVFFRTTQPDIAKVGQTDYAIMVTSSATPLDIASYSAPVRITSSVVGQLQSQEGTAFFFARGLYHVITLDKNLSGELFQNTHFVSGTAHGPYQSAGALDKANYGMASYSDPALFATGHPTYAVRDGEVVGCVMTVSGPDSTVDGGKMGGLSGRLTQEAGDEAYKGKLFAVGTPAIAQEIPAGAYAYVDLRGSTYRAIDPFGIIPADSGGTYAFTIPADGFYRFSAELVATGVFTAGMSLDFRAVRQSDLDIVDILTQVLTLTGSFIRLRGASRIYRYSKGDKLRIQMNNPSNTLITLNNGNTWVALERFM